MDKEPQASTTVAMPSADLMNYFIKETKENFVDVGSKLDAILAQNAHFVSEDKAQKMIDASTKPLKTRLDVWTWYLRVLVVAVLTALGTASAALIAKR